MPKLFFSGTGGSPIEPIYVPRINRVTKYRLLSLHAEYQQFASKWVNFALETTDVTQTELMFDSGAFTAWSKKQEDIKVEDLLKIYKKALRYCIDHKFKSAWFINLDKIPGSPGRTATEEEIENAIKISDDNYRVLAGELGEIVLPVFHQSESVDRLHEIADLNPSYICVSPRNDLREKDRRSWSARTHKEISHIKTHGLAATGDEMMLQVPWHSVDSASWIHCASYGSILYPRSDSRMSALPISSDSPDRRRWGKHIDTMNDRERKRVTEIAGGLELTFEELRTHHRARQLFNAHVMQTLSEQVPEEVPVQQTLLEL